MTGARVILRPFAKINLTLHVGAARPDGFHDVRTVMQAVSITDRLVMTRRRGPFALRSSAAGLAVDRTNLIYRAAAALWRASGRDGAPRDLDVTIEKHIPMAAGLGGGSADAAATLVGANRLWRAGLDARHLAAIAAELGSDVPFFLCGGAAFGAGRGEELYPLADVRRLDVLLVKPEFGVATADAYRWFDVDGGPQARGDGGASIDLGWPTGPLTLVNDLQPPVVRRHIEIQRVIEALMDQRALAAGMTGSGSAVFGLFPRGKGISAGKRLKRSGRTVLVGRTLSRGESGRLMGL
jgi:4-diphosphocytidyl-2-C-methyl-D-erythritol kinase